MARLLLDEAVNDTITLTQRTIAAMLGVQRPSRNKILKELEGDDLIAIGYGTIKINDRLGLTKRAAATPGDSEPGSVAVGSRLEMGAQFRDRSRRLLRVPSGQSRPRRFQADLPHCALGSARVEPRRTRDHHRR